MDFAKFLSKFCSQDTSKRGLKKYMFVNSQYLPLYCHARIHKNMALHMHCITLYMNCLIKQQTYAK